MFKDSFGFIETTSGRFLRVCLNDEPFDGQESHDFAWFTMDAHDSIWETEDAAVILDLLNPWGPLPFLSQDALSGTLPSTHAGGSTYVDLRRFVPVCFRRAMQPVVEGGDDLPLSMEVFVASFSDHRDPGSVILFPISRWRTPPA